MKLLKKRKIFTHFANLSLMIAMLLLQIVASNPGQARFLYPKWYTSLPACSEEQVLAKIIGRFNAAELTLWHYGIRLRSISRMKERPYKPIIDTAIHRRYCRASALMSNGRRYNVHYVIEQGMGLGGFRWNVEYCMKYSDGWHAYDGWCRVLRK